MLQDPFFVVRRRYDGGVQRDHPMTGSIADRFAAQLARLEELDRKQTEATAQHLARVRALIAQLERIDDPLRSDLV